MWRSIAAMIVCIFGFAGSNSLQAAVPVIWDGSAGLNTTLHPSYGGMYRWEEANWTKDGIPGQTALATMGDNTGGRGGMDIIIGGGYTVFHDFNDSTDNVANGGQGLGLGDFRPRMDLNGPGRLIIKEGATLWLDAHTDVDGRWARIGLHATIDNGTFRTTSTEEFCPPSECSVVAGLLIFGYQNELLPNTILQWDIINGGRIEMEGKMIWGNPAFLDGNPSTGHNPGIGMHMTINGGTLDLTGGALYDNYFGLVNGEMVFFYEWNEVTNTPKNEDWRINFTGPGQIIVDNGIFVVDQDADGVFSPRNGLQPDLYTSYTYQQLWDLGILQANGQSGLTGANFSTYFTVSGSPGSPNYTLTSLLAPPGLDGDYNGDGKVDASDYVDWRKNPAAHGGDPGGYNTWRANFGAMSGSGSATAAVPEPTTGAMLLVLGLVSLWVGRSRG